LYDGAGHLRHQSIEDMSMKSICIKQLVLIGMIALLLFQSSVSANLTEDDTTLSPYFQVIGDNSDDLENLPLQNTSATVEISGVIADVKVRQVYRNRGSSVIEAVYVFPGSTRTAVYGMKMTIGERVVVAKIKERKAAKKAYAEAKKQGKRASLLEQQRPNVFQMNVANIMPGDQVVVELFYTELIVPESGVYEFVYPAVVGPRYSETKAQGAADSENWISNPYLHHSVPVPYAFNIDVSVAAGIPIQALTSPSHEVDVDYNEQGKASVRLKADEHSKGDRDYILRYKLRGKEIQTGLLLYKGEQENFFL
jgi:Ca-activated chloride channel family protein